MKDVLEFPFLPDLPSGSPSVNPLNPFDTKLYRPRSIQDTQLARDLLVTLSKGWTEVVDERWFYVSATSFKVYGDMTGKYQKGDKIRLKQGGSYLYFYVTGTSFSDPMTTVSITGGSSYTFTDAVVTDAAYSRIESPFSFPDAFNWTPTLSTSGSMTYTSTSIQYAWFWITGQTLFYQLRVSGTTGGTTSYGLRFTLPVEAKAEMDDAAWSNIGSGNSLGPDSVSVSCLDVSTGEVIYYNGSNWVLSAGRGFSVSGFYRIA